MKSITARILAFFLRLYIRFCYCTSDFSVSPDAEATLRQTWDTGLPTVFAFWHDEFLLLSLNAFCPRLRFPVCITNDSFGGRLVAYFWKGVGAPVVTIGLKATKKSRINQITDALRGGKRIVIAADYGTPWFKARLTSFQVATATGGSVVAMHMACAYELRFRINSWVLRLPLPFNRYFLQLSEPIPAVESVSGLPNLRKRSLWRLQKEWLSSSLWRLRTVDDPQLGVVVGGEHDLHLALHDIKH